MGKGRPFPTVHGMARTKIYKIWSSMIERCYTSTHQAYEQYGGRGIDVCDRWRHSFENFYQDMGERPEGMSLDRINNNEGYSPDNCRWATRRQQMANTRAAHLIEYNGEKLPIAQWARKLGISRNRIFTRLQRGMSAEEALTVLKISQWDEKYGTRKPELKTHCKQGHEFTPENTGRQASGARRCRTCDRIAAQIYNRTKRGRNSARSNPSPS